MIATQNSQPYLDPAVELNARQQALLALCDRYDVVIDNRRTTSGEDIAEFFPILRADMNLRSARTEHRFPAQADVERFCAVTCHDDIHYLYPVYECQEDAEQRAFLHMEDDIFTEMPVAIHDLDTGDRWLPHLSVSWLRPGEEPTK